MTSALGQGFYHLAKVYWRFYFDWKPFVSILDNQFTMSSAEDVTQFLVFRMGKPMSSEKESSPRRKCWVTEKSDVSTFRDRMCYFVVVAAVAGEVLSE